MSATVLHQLGIDHERFTYPYLGLDQRLTGVDHPARVVAEAGTLAEARDVLPERRPELLLVDFGLPDGVGLELVRELRETDVRCVLMSLHDDPAYHLEAEAAGALGFAPKHRLWEALESLLGAG